MTMKQMLLGATAVLMLGAVAVPAMAKGGFGGPMPDFATLDADKDGKVTAAELNAAHEARMQAMDADKDGFVSAEEMIAARKADMPPQMAERMSRKMDKMIGRMDANKDGKVSLDEMRAAHDPARAEAMIAKLDSDGDKAISQAEFDAAKARMAERRGKGGKGEKGGKHGHHAAHHGGPGMGSQGCDMQPGAGRRMMPSVPGNLAPPPAVGQQPFPAPMQ